MKKAVLVILALFALAANSAFAEEGPPITEAEKNNARTNPATKTVVDPSTIPWGAPPEAKNGSADSRNVLSLRLWENGRVPYTIDAAFTQAERDVIAASIDDIEDASCVTWVAREATDSKYVRIHKESDGCFATVGSFPSSIMNLGPGCVYKQVIIHEMLHNMGFWHEQNRIDRDQYVTIDWNNIQPALKFAFFKKEDPTNDLPNCSNDPNLPQSTTFDHCDHGVTGETYGLPYDYRSIMHYGRNFFSITGGDNLVSLPPGESLGNVVLSDLDIQKINAAYPCPVSTTTTSTTSTTSSTTTTNTETTPCTCSCTCGTDTTTVASSTTSLDFCDTVANKTVQPEPTSIQGRPIRYSSIYGRDYLSITSSNGAWEVRSPSFGSCNYEDNILWTWRFTTNNSAYRLRLTLFSLDIDGTAGSCSGDSLRIMRIQGGSVDLCGTTTTAQTFFSSDEEIVVRFMSDASINRGGFYFRIQAQQRSR